MAMPMPYQCVTGLGGSGILCAAQGSQLHTFGADGSLLSSWQHPDLRRGLGGADGSVNSDGIGHEGSEANSDGCEPQAKKRKRAGGSVADAAGSAGRAPHDLPAADELPRTGAGVRTPKGNGDQDRKREAAAGSQLSVPPFVTVVAVTTSGRHVVAVTGTDKTVWVMEHDGDGHLKEVSRRPMPKRPCDLAFTADSSTIICADRFGDVYALPLLQPATPREAHGGGPVAGPRKLRPKGANHLTVHSARNLRVLEEQRKQRERGVPKEKKEGPDFEHDLLLGHVSLLTCVLTASSGGRPYIITADRDEHIRVSRGIPQAHVIEMYCLGHTSFVNALCLPRPDILVSGGGDETLHVWDWRTGLLLSKSDLLRHVRVIAADGAGKVAVRKLCTLSSPAGQLVLVICERVPAIFTFLLQGQGLEYMHHVSLAGHPLDMCVTSAADQAPRLVASVDVTDGHVPTGPSLLAFDWVDGGWIPSPAAFSYTDCTGGQAEVPRSDLDAILYHVESLRKTAGEGDHEDDGGGAAAGPGGGPAMVDTETDGRQEAGSK